MEQTCLRVSELNDELTPHIMLITPLEKTFRWLCSAAKPPQELSREAWNAMIHQKKGEKTEIGAMRSFPPINQNFTQATCIA
jgi:hypothetical protein